MRVMILKRMVRMVHQLSAPVELRVQSLSSTPLRIVASIAFLFRACFTGFETQEHHYRTVEVPKRFRTRL